MAARVSTLLAVPRQQRPDLSTGGWQRWARALCDSVGQCQDCGAKPPDVRLSVDHVRPRSGADGYRVLCVPCNSRKSIRAHPRDSKGRLLPIFGAGKPLMTDRKSVV